MLEETKSIPSGLRHEDRILIVTRPAAATYVARH